MSQPLKRYVALTAVLILTGCAQSYNYDYLVRHPATLKSELDKCQNSSGSRDANYCAMVNKAAATLMEQLTQQQEEPEAFGQKIIDAETALANLNKEMSQTTDPKHLAALKQAYAAKQNELEILLAVMSMSTPE